MSRLLPTTLSGSPVAFATSGNARASADVSTEKKLGLQQTYMELLKSKSFDEVVRVIESDKLHYNIPKPVTSVEFQRLLQSDPYYLIVLLRDIAQSIQENLRPEYTVEQFLMCFRAYLRTMGLPKHLLTNEEAKMRNGFTYSNVDMEIETRVCGDGISKHKIFAMHVHHVCHVPYDLIIMVYMNRPPPVSAQDIASGADLDMFQDLFSVMSKLSEVSNSSIKPSVGRMGFVSIFDTVKGKNAGSQVRTFACKLNETRTDMYTLFDGMSDDTRVRDYMELVMGEEEREAMSRQPEFEREMKEKKKKVYEENMKKDVLANRVLISHGGISVQKILNNQEITWNSFLDSQINFLQEEVTKLRLEKEEIMKRNQDFARKRSLPQLPIPDQQNKQARMSQPPLPPNAHQNQQQQHPPVPTFPRNPLPGGRRR